MRRRIKGFRDIKKHSDLSKSGTLQGISISFGFGRPSNFARKKMAFQKDWDGKIEQHLYNKGNGNGNGDQAKKQFLLEEERRILKIIELLEQDVEDVLEFVAEDIPGAEKMLQEIEEKLDKCRKYYLRHFKK